MGLVRLSTPGVSGECRGSCLDIGSGLWGPGQSHEVSVVS